MPQLDTFIKDARAKNLSDDDIRSALVAQGWDAAVINAALVGIDVPKPTEQGNTSKKPTPQSATPIHAKHPSLSPLMAALHHILLWFFTGSSTITIAGVVSSLFGTSVSSTALASMIAVTVITFIPYATLFLMYLIKTRKTPDLIPGKVWSIITICLHSIGAMIAAITLVVNSITDGGSTLIVSAALILFLDIVIVKTYLFAAFSPETLRKFRTISLVAYLPILFILFGVLFGMSAFKLGPAQHDEDVRQALTTSVRKIADYTRENNKLPESTSDATTDVAVTYNKITTDTYEVCATFQTSNRQDDDSYSDYRSYDQTDSYVSQSDFSNTASGHQCFKFKSDFLSNDYRRPQ